MKKIPRSFGVPHVLPVLTAANAIALVIGAIILSAGIGVMIPLSSQAAEARATANEIDATREQLHNWQSVAPGVIRDEAKARAQLRPFCGLGSDLNRVLLQIADHVSRAHVRVSQGNYQVDPLLPVTTPAATSSVATQTALASPGPSPSPAATPTLNNVAAANVPTVVDGIASISKSLSLEGRYPDIVRALASVDDLHYPATAAISSITRKSEDTVTFVVMVTVRVPVPSVCSDTAAPSPHRSLPLSTTTESTS